jgi:hypothetical protein
MSALSYELISAADYEHLPEDPEECFVALEDICQRNMNRMIDENTSNDFDTAVHLQYTATVTGYAKECGISEIVQSSNFDFHGESAYQDFAKFQLAVKGAVARIRFKNRTVLRSSSVLLLQNTKTKIDHYISRLREIIENSDLPADRQDALCKKLEELRGELHQPRLSFIKAFTVLSLVLAGLGSATTVSADAPHAVTNIMRLIGLDRQTEEAAARRLAPPPKALPAPATHAHPPGKPQAPPSTRQRTYAAPPRGGDLDDEIPF